MQTLSGVQDTNLQERSHPEYLEHLATKASISLWDINPLKEPPKEPTPLQEAYAYVVIG